MNVNQPATAADQTPAGQTLDEFLGVPPESPWRRWLKPLAIAGAVLLLLFVLWRWFAPPEKPRYVTGEVARGELTVSVSATGNIRPINQVDVGSEQSGLITEVYVDVNDPVKKGQLLAQLDPSRLQDAVTQAQAGLAAAEAAVVQARATRSQTDATLARYREVAKLSDGRVPSKTEMDSAVADQERAAATLKSSEAQVLQQRAALGSAQTSLSKTRIYSPANGVVLSRDIEPGQTVAASFNAPVLFTIAEDLAQMELQVSIDEADVGEVKDGQEASFTVDAFPGRSFEARIRRVNLGSNESASASSTAASTGQVVAYTALLSVDNGEQLLRPGMTATADIITTKLENALLVPNAAFRFRPEAGAAGQDKGGGGITGALINRRPFGNRPERTATTERGAQQTIYVADETGNLQQVTVTTGSSNGAVTELLSDNLKEGQKVVTGQLAPGARAPTDGNRPGGGRGKAG